MNDIAPSRYKWVGTRPVRPDGVPKVTGRALYGADLVMAGALYGKIIRSPARPCADLLDRRVERAQIAWRQGGGDLGRLSRS